MTTGETISDEFRRERRRGDARLSAEGRAILQRITSGDLADDFAAALHEVGADDAALAPDRAAATK
jgi:hypothetical protein